MNLYFSDFDPLPLYDLVNSKLLFSDVLTDVESAADLLEENLREKIVPFKAQDIETVKKLESKNGWL